MYNPKPIDTSDVSLDESILALCERLAENTHDVWASARIANGWRYGKHRDDTAKLHPCLIPYSELPESEKEYDRKTVVETLKATIKLGYTIIK